MQNERLCQMMRHPLRCLPALATLLLPSTGFAQFEDYDGDGTTDISFHRSDAGWNTTPILFGNGDGTWSSENQRTPSWANERWVLRATGDFNGDGMTDVFYYRPEIFASLLNPQGAPAWTRIRLLLSQGNGTWQAVDAPAPSWLTEPGVAVMVGRFDGDARDDLAFYRPQLFTEPGRWTQVPVLLSNGNGTWREVRRTNLPDWVGQPFIRAVAGDFDGDGFTDLAFTRPDARWASVPVLFSRGDGTWRWTNLSAPSWASAFGSKPIAGDFDGDNLTDIAFHNPGSSWQTVPVLFATGTGRWIPRNESATPLAHEQFKPFIGRKDAIPLTGDFDGDGSTDIAFKLPSGRAVLPVILSRGGGRWESHVPAIPTYWDFERAGAIVGDFGWGDADEVAFFNSGSAWNTAPVLRGVRWTLFSSPNFFWFAQNQPAPGWVNQPGVTAHQRCPRGRCSPE